MNRRAIVLLSLLIATAAIADQPRLFRSFMSADGQFEFKVTTPSERNPTTGAWTPETWSLQDNQRGQRLYTLDGLFGSRTALISSNGRYLVVIDDYSDRLVANDLDVLAFYRNGELLRRYALGKLVRDAQQVSHSASHFDWCFGPVKTGLNDSSFSVTTYDLVTHVFALETGDLTAESRSPLLGDRTLYVYGPITRVGRGRYAVEVKCSLFGDIPCGTSLQFSQTSELPSVSSTWPVVRRKLTSSDRYLGVIVQDGHYIGHTEVMLNACGC